MIDVQMPTVGWFAALPMAWPESVDLGRAMLVARIHPQHNRVEGDEDVIARILVFDKCEGLCRMTIRTGMLTASVDRDHLGQVIVFDDYAKLYRDTLIQVMRLPVMELIVE